jgi:hypothetical protein
VSDHEYRTKSDKVLTETDLDALADEAERGYDLSDPEKRRRGYEIVNNGWQEHAGVYEVLVRKANEDTWTRLEGFELQPLLQRAREIARGT